jgi:hypothetical protein
MTMSSQTVAFETTGLSLNPIAKPVLLVLGVGVLLSPLALNDSLVALAFATLFGIVALTWQAEAPPVAMLICGAQWLQGSLKLLNAEVEGVELWTLSVSKNVGQASVLTMLWALVLALGMRLGMRNARVPKDVPLLSVRVALIVYLIWSAALPMLGLALPGQARQVFVALSDLRWATVFALFLCVLAARRGFMVLAVVLSVELMLGFLSFFSNFRTVLIVFVLALLARAQSFSLRTLLGVAVAMGVAIYLGILWTAVKSDYRTAMNRGTDDQNVLIDTNQQASELQRLVEGVDRTGFEKATDRFVDRIAYVDYFAYTLDFVPTVRSHEEGRMWWGAVEHVFMPRVLFPDKAPLPSDTEVAERYTGMRLTQNRTGTSISIGLPAETYVDFGVPWMLAPAVLLGLLYGLVFRALLMQRHHAPYGAGLAVAIGMTHMLLASSAAKAVGSLLTLALLATLTARVLLPPLLGFASQLVFSGRGKDGSRG